MPTDYQNEYLRLIKIILNHNVVVNKNAWYECQVKGQYLYYCKYIVYGIPQYYGEHFNLEKVEDAITEKHSSIFLLNKNIKISNISNKAELSNTILEYFEKNHQHLKIEEIIKKRSMLLKYGCCLDEDEYLQKENEVFGIIDKIENPIYERKFYLSQVTLSWPVRNNSNPPHEDCLVRLKCKTDLLFEQFNTTYHNIINTILDNQKIIEEHMHRTMTPEQLVELFIDKCFFTYSSNSVIIYKLLDRKSDTSTTYNKVNSPSGWAEHYQLINGKLIMDLFSH